MLVDLALLTVLAQHAPEDTLSPHPENLGRHTGLGGTLALSGTSVTTLGLGGIVSTNARAGVNGLGLDDDVAVLLEGADAVGAVICQYTVSSHSALDRVPLGQLAIQAVSLGRGKRTFASSWRWQSPKGETGRGKSSSFRRRGPVQT